MYPYQNALAIHKSTNGTVYSYWLDANNNFYECPNNPYLKDAIRTKKERPYEWKRKVVEKIFRHKDDPEHLMQDEWEYRDVLVWYKSYI